MGTNYYWRDNPCDHCGRYNEVHVGKQSMGWSFGFRAWEHKLVDDEHPDWGYSVESPLGYEIASRADWLKVFTSRRGELWDEYGRRVDDPIAWLEALQPPDAEQIAKEDNMRSGSHHRFDTTWHREREHRDAEGFHFDACEFS